MEVTKSNFKDTLSIVKQAITDSTFLAVDTEFTGLKNTERAFDTMEERYRMLCESSRKYLVIQFGLSCFQYHANEKKYTHKDFNFYIFPRQHSHQAPDTLFTCQASSINYLASHGFDFNKVFHEGISYLTPDQEERIQQNLNTYHNEKIEAFSQEMKDNKNKAPKETRQIAIPNEHKTFIDGIEKQLNAFVASDDETQLNLPPCSGYRRKIIYESVLPKYPSGIVMSTTQNEKKESHIVVTKMTDELRLSQMQEKQASDLEELDDAVGFRKVLDLISKSKKLIVGHNMLLDLIHLISQFYHHLPSSLGEFKQIVKTVFPHIMDTKTLANAPSTKDIFSSNALFNLWEEIKSKSLPVPAVEPAENFECYSDKCSKEHEAGYDAFITGLCFISLSAKHAIDNSREYIPPDSKFLSHYANRPYIMKHFDISSLNLDGPDPEPSRDHVFFVTFPKEWKTIDLVELFTPYGEVYVSWVNDVSAFVALKAPVQAVNVKRNLLKHTGSVYKVQSYAEYRDIVSFKSPSCTANSSDHPSSKRRRRSSAGSTDSSTNRSITPILEEDENIISEKQDNCVSTSHDSGSAADNNISATPKSKRQKTSSDEPENNVVSSTEKLFEEPNVW